MIESVFIFIASLFFVIKGATLATKYSAKLAENFNFSKYVIGFIVVAFISILPETIISINAAIEGVPEFGLGTLFGSNVADLTLVFAIMILFAGRGIKIESTILKDVRIFPFFLLLPILFGLNGHYSRMEGVVLLLIGILFYYLIFRDGSEAVKIYNKDGKYKNAFFLIFAMFLLLVGAHFTVTSATSLAHLLNVSPILIGLFIVGIGTTMPELFYSLKAVKKKEDGLAVGDLMGTVLADATIVVGILAILDPFYFPVKIIYITGSFMVFASLVLLNFMKSGRVITKKEGFMLLFFWIAYLFIEFLLSRI